MNTDRPSVYRALKVFELTLFYDIITFFLAVLGPALPSLLDPLATPVHGKIESTITVAADWLLYHSHSCEIIQTRTSLRVIA